MLKKCEFLFVSNCSREQSIFYFMVLLEVHDILGNHLQIHSSKTPSHSWCPTFIAIHYHWKNNALTIPIFMVIRYPYLLWSCLNISVIIFRINLFTNAVSSSSGMMWVSLPSILLGISIVLICNKSDFHVLLLFSQ